MSGSRRRGPYGDAGRQSTVSLRRRVEEQLAGAERIMAALREELGEYRRQNQVLSRERDRLQRSLTKRAAVSIQRTKLEARESVHERAREVLEQSQRDLQGENDTLAERCERLERALAAERQENETLQLELTCASEQVDELTAIMNLLAAETADDEPPASGEQGEP